MKKGLLIAVIAAAALCPWTARAQEEEDAPAQAEQASEERETGQPQKQEEAQRPADPAAGAQGLGNAQGVSQGQAVKRTSPNMDTYKKESDGPRFAPCQFGDVGGDALWKFPSESWRDGAAFIPPVRACRTAEIKDAKGNGTGSFRLLYNHITGVYLCADKGCSTNASFDAVGFGEFCVWRVRRGTWRKAFGSADFGVVMALHDGRWIRWDLKDPEARNGYGPYRDLKYTVAPYCYRTLY